MESGAKIIVLFSTLGIAIMGLVLIIPFKIGLLDSGKFIDSFLTGIIAIFAMVQAHSTLLQVRLENRRNKIIDASKELEKAYGPLFDILNYRARYDESRKKLRIEKPYYESIDNIMAKYPRMFPDEINELWIKIRPPIATDSDFRTDIPPFSDKIHYYDVSPEFKDKLNEEYHRRVERYTELLEK